MVAQNTKSDGSAIECYVGYYDSSEANAVAFSSQGLHCVGISIEMVRELGARARRLSTSESFLSTAISIAGWHTTGGAPVESSLHQILLHWLLFHELAHHYLGDPGPSHLFEFDPADGDLTTQGCELLADEIATNLIATNLLSMRAGEKQQIDLMTDLRGVAFAILYSMIGFFLLAGLGPARSISRHRHPPPIVRLRFILFHFNRQLASVGLEPLGDEIVASAFHEIASTLGLHDQWLQVEEFLGTEDGWKYLYELELKRNELSKRPRPWVERT
ncbi:hypothetical protein F183_A39170 [Bryobacterales bacterium F-183]|nr:hypothetical protein F183_A39170 [Bryobacterales bacterium F-183]